MTASGEADSRAQSSEMGEPTRSQILQKVPTKTLVFGIPFRRLTTGELLEQLLLAAAESEYIETGNMEHLLMVRNSIAAPQPSTTQDRSLKDPLDWVRVVATLIMVAALFVIVYVVVIKPNPATGATQLVSLASGLAGIGLGWLFGTGIARGKK
jgi:hypothetical protein